MCVCACVRASVSVCVCVRTCVHVSVCRSVCACVRAWVFQLLVTPAAIQTVRVTRGYPKFALKMTATRGKITSLSPTKVSCHTAVPFTFDPYLQYHIIFYIFLNGRGSKNTVVLLCAVMILKLRECCVAYTAGERDPSRAFPSFCLLHSTSGNAHTAWTNGQEL